METPRAYQAAIVETCKKNNTLVVLPTGLGKTLIALMLSQERLKEFPESKILFLAPTRPLVEQHYHYFKKNFAEDYEMHIFTGKINPAKRAEIWKTAQVVFSTPQCIHFDLKNNLISMENVSLLIEDECHRCLKNYSYTYVSKNYSENAGNPRILGLTASPSSDAKIIREICDNLNIKALEIRTRESGDVGPYLQKLSYDIVKVELPEDFKKARVVLAEIYKKKVDELKNRKLLFGPATKRNILELQLRLRKMITGGNNHFNVLRGISVCAQAIKLGYALELLETQSLESCLSYLNDLFEQARQNKSKGVKQITKEIGSVYLELINLQKENKEHPKLERLREIMIRELEAKPDFRAIIFSQYRNTIAQINKMLLKQGIRSNQFIGQAKRKLDGMSQKEQQLILHNFKEGKINCLIASSIGEEGLDIPEVDLVVFYEPIPSAIRKIQRAGRTARLKPGKLIILLTKGTRDESNHWAAFHKEKKMYSSLENLKDGMQKKQKEISEF
jgi:Fanconi anemia group M protein